MTKQLTDEEWAMSILPINAKPQLLTVKEAAAFLSITSDQVRLYIKDGKLKAHRLGNGKGKRESKRPWRIWRRDLLEFVNRSSNIEVNNE